MEKIYSFFKFLENRKGKTPPLKALLKHEPDKIRELNGVLSSLNFIEINREFTEEQINALAKVLQKEKTITVEGDLTLINQSKLYPLLSIFLTKPVTVKKQISVISLDRFPPNITVLGNINLRDIKEPGKALPDNYTVRKSLSITSSQIDQLPNNLHVLGNVYIMGLPNFTFLPRGLKIEGELRIYDTGFDRKLRTMGSGQRRKYIDALLQERGGYLKGKLFTSSYHEDTGTFIF